MMSFAGTGRLLRLAARRDRILLPIWIILFALSAAGSASATMELYPTVQSRVLASEAVNASPALVAMYGRLNDPTSLGELSMLKLTVMGSALVGVLMVMLAVRHTRREEESGRLELISAGTIGCFANLAAALILCWCASVALGLLTAVSLIAVGLPASGSLAFGGAWAGVGIVFASIAAVAAQIAPTARTANAIGLLVLGVAYLIRMAANLANGGTAWFGWLSPLGQAQQVQAFSGDRFAVLLLMALVAVCIAIGAFLLRSIRDLGAGLLPERTGRDNASRALSGQWGLAMRLQWPGFVIWLIAFITLGSVLGSIATTAPSFVDSDATRDLFARLGGTTVITDAFVATEMAFVGFVAAAYGIQACLRLASEERNQHSELTLSTAVSRTRLATSHIVIAMVGVAVLAAAAGLAGGVVFAMQVSDPGMISRVFVAALVQVPAAWVLVGFAALAYGVMPRAVMVSWALLVALMLLGELGPLFQLSTTVLDISPFAHVPRYPLDQILIAPLAVLALIGGCLAVAGVGTFRRRDVH